MEDYQVRRVNRCDACGMVGDGHRCRFCGGRRFSVEVEEYEELTEDIVTRNGTTIPAVTEQRDEFGQIALEPLTDGAGVTKERSGGGAQYKTYSQPGSASSGSASGPYRDVRAAINAGDLSRAEMILGSIVDRNAEWYFLTGAVCYRRGWMDEASRNFRQAATMDPGNVEYRQAVAQMESAARNPFSTGGTGDMSSVNCSPLCPCMALMAATGGCVPCFCWI